MMLKLSVMLKCETCPLPVDLLPESTLNDPNQEVKKELVDPKLPIRILMNNYTCPPGRNQWQLDITENHLSGIYGDHIKQN